MILEKKNKKYIICIVSVLFLIIITVILSNNHIYNNEVTVNDSDKEVIVLFRDFIKEEDLSDIIAQYGDSVQIKIHFEDYALLSANDDQTYQEIQTYLRNHPMVKAVQPNGSVQIMQTSNDTYASTQWAIHNPGYYYILTSGGVKEIPASADIDMDVVEAWQYIKQTKLKSRQVVVAVIDTGVDYTHPDLAKNIWVNTNEIPGDGIDNDKNGYVDDIYGWDFYNDDSSVCHYKYDKKTKLNLALPEDNDDHGTHIAGIIGAVADNGIGIAGIASAIDVKIMVLKINGGTQGTGSISDAILAIKYATMMGADICNISWGTNQYSPALLEVMKESDMLFIAAAGNLGSDNDIKPVYPASFKLDNLISVTFIDANGNLKKQSNYGKTTVEIAAPGSDILSTVVGTYQTLSGTSMAAPHVSAVASLLYSSYDNLYPLAVKNIILKTLKPVTSLEGYMVYPGIPSAYKALLVMGEARRDNVKPDLKLSTIYDKGDLIVSVEPEDEGGSGIRVIRWLPGNNSIEAFNRGTSGLTVDNMQVKVSKAGTYTFYVSDYAGNENIQVYDVEDDTTPPTISASFSVSDDYKKRTVTVKVSDKQSGIKRVKYMAGNRKASDFLPAGSGTEIKLKDGKATFDVRQDGTYTVYAIDNRGNQRVKTIVIKTIKSEDIKLTRYEITLTVGEEYALKPFVKPANTTDKITYSSSNERVASVKSNGKITAIGEGTATISVRTSSGHKALCKVVVKKAD